MTAYYNEIDPQAAQWLRNLIARNLIAPGEVDERSIVEVQPDDLRGFTQCHFFAGIGVWSHALRLAGWPDDRPVWTGSCPCQPFSVAGQQRGSEDERHLWPAFFRLIRERRPDACFGEQVSGTNGAAWLDHVCADLEGVGYAVGALSATAAGVGAPHIRQRLYWVADSKLGAAERHGFSLAGEARGSGGEGDQRQRAWDDDRHGGVSCGVADDQHARLGIRGEAHDHDRRDAPRSDADGRGKDGSRRLAHSSGEGLPEQRGRRDQSARQPTAGFWRDANWIACRDGKARPVEPGTFPLAYGAPARVVRLRAYGNAIVAPQAAAFVGAYMMAERRIRGDAPLFAEVA